MKEQSLQLQLVYEALGLTFEHRPPDFEAKALTTRLHVLQPVECAGTLLFAVSRFSLFIFTRSMLPDVIDDFYVTHGEHKDAIFYSFYVFFNKLATGLAVATSQLALK